MHNDDPHRGLHHLRSRRMGSHTYYYWQEGRGVCRLKRVIVVPEPRLRGVLQRRTGRNRRAYSRQHDTDPPCQQEDADLLIPLGLLWLPHLYLRGQERGEGSLRQRLQPRKDRRRGDRLLFWHPRLRYGHGDGLRCRQGCALSALHSQIHSDMAALVHTIQPVDALARG